jgi:hypothetical protein
VASPRAGGVVMVAATATAVLTLAQTTLLLRLLTMTLLAATTMPIMQRTMVTQQSLRAPLIVASLVERSRSRKSTAVAVSL